MVEEEISLLVVVEEHKILEDEILLLEVEVNIKVEDQILVIMVVVMAKQILLVQDHLFSVKFVVGMTILHLSDGIVLTLITL